MDYEATVNKQRTVIANDPQRDLLLFPTDDFHCSRLPRNKRTADPPLEQPCSPFARECLRQYASDWHFVVWKYSDWSGSFRELSKLPRNADLSPHVFECDARDELDGDGGGRFKLAKEGYVMKGTNSDKLLMTKSLKRRWMSLRQEVDGTSILEFYKDGRKSDSKGAICLDFCNKVIRVCQWRRLRARQSKSAGWL